MYINPLAILDVNKLLYYINFADCAAGALPAPWAGSTWNIGNVSGRNYARNVISTLGADVVINGTFTTDTNWTKGAEWTISGGLANKGGVAYTAIEQNVLTADKWYKVVLDKNASGMDVQGGPNAPLYGLVNGTTGIYALILAKTAALQLYGYTNGLTLDNVSAKQLTLTELIAYLPAYPTEDVTVESKLALINQGTNWGIFCCMDNPAAPTNYIILMVNNSQIKGYYFSGGAYTIYMTTSLSGRTKFSMRKFQDTLTIYADDVPISQNSGMGVFTGKYVGMFAAQLADIQYEYFAVKKS